MPGSGDRWFPTYGLGNPLNALRGAADAVRRAPARPRPLPQSPPPPPLPPAGPEAMKEVGDAVIDAIDGATRADPADRAQEAARAAAEGRMKGDIAQGIARTIVPGSGPIATFNEQAIAPVIEKLIEHVSIPPLPPRKSPARAEPTAEMTREDYLAEWRDPYLAINEQARREGREASREERLEFERLPEEQWRSRGRQARYDYSFERAKAAFDAAKRRGVDPRSDPEFLFWNDRREHDLQALNDADARSRTGR